MRRVKTTSISCDNNEQFKKSKAVACAREPVVDTLAARHLWKATEEVEGIYRWTMDVQPTDLVGGETRGTPYRQYDGVVRLERRSESY